MFVFIIRSSVPTEAAISAEALDTLDGVGKSLATRGLLTFSRRTGYSDSTYAVHVGDIFFFLRLEHREHSSGLLVLAAKEIFNDLQRVAIHLSWLSEISKIKQVT